VQYAAEATQMTNDGAAGRSREERNRKPLCSTMLVVGFGFVLSLLCCIIFLMTNGSDENLLSQVHGNKPKLYVPNAGNMNISAELNGHETSTLHVPEAGSRKTLAELNARLEFLPSDDDLDEIRIEMAQAEAELAAQVERRLKAAMSCAAPANAMEAAVAKASTYSSPLIKKTKEHWVQYVANRTAESPSSRAKYCLWQCEDNVCCPGGYREANHFHVVRDSMQRYGADDGVSDVTLVTQATVNRIEMFRAQAERWPGPKVIIFSVYNHTLERHVSAASELNQIREASLSWGNVRVLAFTITHIGSAGLAVDTYSKGMVDPMLTLYPINALRNVVVDQARTNWVFPVDVDFIPSKQLYNRVTRVLLPRLANVERAALVVPHFELLEDPNLHSETPGDFAALDSGLRLGKVVPFHSDPNLVLPGVETDSDYAKTWPQGIAASNYSRWYHESKYGLSGFSRILPPTHPATYTSRFWEPFLMVRKVEASPKIELPRYQERYVGRFRNKVEWVRTLRANKYKFYHMLQEHLAHMPHEVLLSNPNDPDAKIMKKLMFGVDDNRVREVARIDEKVEKPPDGMYEEGWHCIL